MSHGQSWGGEEHVSERLPYGHLDEMASMLWKIGNYNYGDTLQSIMAPSIFQAATLSVDNLKLDLGFTFRQNSITEAPEPTVYTGIVSEHDPYSQQDGATICIWRQFTLDMRQRRKKFAKGASILLDEGEVFLTDDQPIGARRKRGTAEWRQVEKLGRICTRDDYESYMNGLRIIHYGLKQQTSE